MKDEIVVKGKKYFFKTFITDDVDYYTRFWTKNKVIFGRVSCFSKKRKLIVPDYLFTIHRDSRDLRLTKRWWKEKIEIEVDLLTRNDQLQNGELI